LCGFVVGLHRTDQSANEISIHHLSWQAGTKYHLAPPYQSLIGNGPHRKSTIGKGLPIKAPRSKIRWRFRHRMRPIRVVPKGDDLLPGKRFSESGCKGFKCFSCVKNWPQSGDLQYVARGLAFGLMAMLGPCRPVLRRLPLALGPKVAGASAAGFHRPAPCTAAVASGPLPSTAH